MIKDFKGEEHVILDAAAQEITKGFAWCLGNPVERQFSAYRAEIIEYYLDKIVYKDPHGKKRTTKYGRKFIMIKEDTNGNNKG